MLSQSDQVRDAVNSMTDGKFILSIYFILFYYPVWAIDDVVFCLQSLLIFASI